MKIAFQIMSDVHELVDYELTCPCITHVVTQAQRLLADRTQHAESQECPISCADTWGSTALGVPSWCQPSKTAALNVTGDSQVYAISRV